MITLTAHLQKYGMKCCPIDNSIKMIGKKFTFAHTPQYDSAKTEKV